MNAQEATAIERANAQGRRANQPPRVVQAERFLAQRGWTSGRAIGLRSSRRANAATAQSQLVLESQTISENQTTGTATWQPLGPVAVTSQSYGLVTGRISSLALDPSDTTGNTLYVGTTGGGVWKSQNADTSSSSNISFLPLTDELPAMSNAQDSSISIGALTVQPGGTGVILAGTGDPNDALDSYYGAGILRSTNGGSTWSLIPGASGGIYSFAGEGFAGFAWSTVNQQLVVAAVSQSYEGTLVNAVLPGASYEGLYYSMDGGATWALARITDGAGGDVQVPGGVFVYPDGNAATSVVWNPVRKLFLAAVRYHGYYQSSDGITFTRMANQPGASSSSTTPSLSSAWCPTNASSTGSQGCPIFRGTLAVNPQTGDTFAWTVDEFNQDQGIWQDVCTVSNNACVSSTVTFAQQWNTAALDDVENPGTIRNGDYNLTLAAIPSGQETLLLAGDNDLWETDCPYSQGCVWRNTTNSTDCMSAEVGEYQHTLAWNPSNPLEIFIGNDSGLWRSTDAIGETGAVCSSSDASHFQNLNGSLGSLAEVESISQVGSTPYTMMAGLGANGIAGVNNASATADWPEILSGEGGPVAIDPVNSNNWYANNAAGVSIYLGAPPTGSTPGVFNAVLDYSTDPSSYTTSNADVVRDGLSMAEEPPYAPAAFLVDPLDHTKLLIASCRVWRGPASGVGWSAGNAISGILDGITGDNDCSANALIRSMAAMALPASTALPSGGEVVYVGMRGLGNGGATLPGHILSMTYNSATSHWSAPVDLTEVNPVANDVHTMNYYGLDISSVFIDSHDPTGKTVYATVAGIPTISEDVQSVYGSTNGGVQWSDLTSSLPSAPANSLVVDPQDANTVYVSTDAGVYSTRQISSCSTPGNDCWTALGSGLPNAPVVELSAAPVSASVQNLVAATYGRGIWMIPLLGAGGTGTGPATDTLSSATLTFADTVVGELSAAQTVTLTNSGGVPLTAIAVSVSGAFEETSSCGPSLAAQSSCAISVIYAPSLASSQTGTLTVSDVLRTQPVSLSGTGVSPPVLGVSPASLSFSNQTVGVASSAQGITVSNTGGAPLANVGFQISGLSATSFSVSTTTCGVTLANGSNCTAQVIFTPAAAGGATATLAVTSSTLGVTPATVALSGVGVTAVGLNVNPSQLVFPIVAPGQSSPALTVTINNTGGSAANGLTLTATPPFSLVQNTCAATLAANSSCSTGVIFSPSLNGPYTGTLAIASSSPTFSASVPLSGTGGTPGSVQFQPSVVAFMQTGLNQLSSPSSVTITNPDNVNSLGSFALAVSGSFKLVSTTCISTLAAASSCTAVVEFAPVTPGAQSGNLTVTSSSLPTGSFLALSGVGFDFALATSGASSQTIANGQTADYKLSITPLDGSQGVFTFQCGTLPAYSSCSFNPSSVGVTANNSGYEVVEIATGLSSTSARTGPHSAWPVLPLACVLVLAPFALTWRRRALLLVAVLAIVAGGVSSCNSSGVILGGQGGGGGSGITGAGTYSIPVTATSNGIQHQITVTLIVD